MIIGRQLIEESQKLFSTGNEELDNILEEVYYSGIEDGYDYAQKEFSDSKLKWRARTDIKMINKINKNHGGKPEENIKSYKEALNNPNLSEKKRKSIEALIDEEKLAAGMISEDEFIKKYPKMAKKGR